MKKKDRLEGCYYGKRQVVYVLVRTAEGTVSKHYSVYGYSVKDVARAVDHGLSEAFGRHGAPRPAGRPVGRPRKVPLPDERTAHQMGKTNARKRT